MARVESSLTTAADWYASAAEPVDPTTQFLVVLG